jgi:hypothetical protein
MLAVSPSRSRNRLLAALTPADLKILQLLQPVPLRLRQEMGRPNRPIDDVYFPGTGIASVVAVQSKDTRVRLD